ncbi:MAG: hypothetical protein M1816_006660 [Peltula sp. TS41687]|nr:MAG: hypothetical protein M1816_006660 [Peltula sp. TS41687]
MALSILGSELKGKNIAEMVRVNILQYFRAQIHVDQYKWRIYKSLTETTQSSQQHTERQMPITGYGPALCGYNFGNSFQLGFRITPIITRTSNNKVITEPGAGGGDLRQIHDLELGNAGMTDQLMQLCLHHLADQRLVDEISSMLQRAVSRGKSTLSLNGLGLDSEDIDVPLLDVVQLLVRRVSKDSERQQQKADPAHSKEPGLHQPNHSVRSSRKELPRTLTFPYSRHSSYQELCHLVEAFRPKDVYPCVVDQEYAADSETSIETLFGHLCSGTGFAYDEEVLQHPMKKARTSRSEEDLTRSSTQRTSEPETSQTAETASTTMHAPQQHRHDNHRGEATHEQQPSSAAVESASHANGGIVPDTPKPHLPSETHNRPSPRFQLNLGVKSQANRVETIKKSFRRRRPAGRTDDKTRSAQVHSHTTMQDQIQTRSNNAAGSISAQAATSAESARGVGSALVQNSQRRGVTEDPNSVARQADTQYRCIGTASTSTSQYKDEDEDEEMLEALFDSQSTTIGKEELAARLGRRGEAYKAVAVDEWESTSAWSVHSPLTAGNNHTEEEMVL